MLPAPPARHLDDDRPDRSQYGRPFLASHRAVAACTREFARLGDEVVRGIAELPGAMGDEKAAVRRSPERCIVQFGGVAVTLAWLRGSQDSVAEGELLVIVWRGTVAPRHRHQPERPTGGPASLGATPLWEQILTAVGESEETWGWQAHGDDTLARCSSTELAARCVARLGDAYLERDAHCVSIAMP